VSIAEGQTVGNYRILARIGTGGMGAVYLAEHPLIGKRVALKAIHRELSGNREVISRFFNEARAVNKIGNEHIVEIHDFGQAPGGEHFFIMEYLEGQTLAQVLERERGLRVPRALHVAAQIAAALAAAHAAGIVHRDLKPDNIMLVPRLGDPDFVKVLDFGLAKMFADGGAQLTAAGVVLGTPQYMSPEACESRKTLDHRTDIYALGVLLFQMVTGQLPFDGDSMGDILIKQVIHAPPAPRGLNPEIPPSVEQIILRCLAKQPDSRFPTMLALRDALRDPERYLASSPPVMPAAPVAAAQARTMFLDPQAGAPPPPVAPTGPAMPLRPPPPSVIAAPDQRTVFGAPAATSPPPFGGTGPLPVLDGSGRGSARTIAMVPELQHPEPVQNRTMVIATPPGYSARPPRRAWPLVVAGLAVLAIAGGVFAAVTMDEAPAVAAVDAGVAIDAGAVAALADAALPVVDAPPPPPPTARLRVESVPDGAEVSTGEGKPLGATPMTLEVAVGTSLVLVFRHPDTKDKRKDVTVDGDATITTELERLEKKPEPRRPRRPSKPTLPEDGIGNRVLRPDF
jgi:tRNA A-37 threonylcarbamoyl transferase component Bud32